MAEETERLEWSPDDDSLANLAGRRQELLIVIHDLKASRPSLAISLLALQLSLILLLGSIGLVLAPYLRPEFPKPISTLAAFVAVILSFVSYLSFRRFSAEYERLRLYKTVVERATYLDEVAGELLKKAESLYFASTGT